jgi:hypothetical protein
MTANVTHGLMTLSVALLFAAIFLFGGRAAYRPGQKGRRRFVSFAGGIAVAYAFVHVLPAHAMISEFHTESPTGFQRFFPEYSVYLWSMAGFFLFYGLQFLAHRPAGATAHNPEGEMNAGTWRSWVHIAGFVLYAWLITFLMVWTGKAQLALCLFAVAMGMHLFPIACHLRSHHQTVYDRRGAYLLALACLGGWACGLTLNIPKATVFDLVAVVAGGVIVNAAIAELPKEGEGRYWYFLSGAVVYTALLLTLSHFEKER